MEVTLMAPKGRLFCLGVFAHALAHAGAVGPSNVQSFTDDRGVTSDYLVKVPPGATTRPSCLIVFLHGDSGNDFRSGFRRIGKEADKYGCIALSVRSPR